MGSLEMEALNQGGGVYSYINYNVYMCIYIPEALNQSEGVDLDSLMADLCSIEQELTTVNTKTRLGLTDTKVLYTVYMLHTLCMFTCTLQCQLVNVVKVTVVMRVLMFVL